MVRDVARGFLTHLNGILANFNHCDLQTKYRLFVSYCTSYYGSCLWDLQHKLVDVFIQHGERLSDVYSGYRGMLIVISYH